MFIFKDNKNTVLSVNLSCKPETTKENKKVKPGIIIFYLFLYS